MCKVSLLEKVGVMDWIKFFFLFLFLVLFVLLAFGISLTRLFVVAIILAINHFDFSISTLLFSCRKIMCHRGMRATSFNP